MHSTTSVRHATLQTLLTLTSSNGTALLWDHVTLQEALRYIYQRALIEPTMDIVEKVNGIMIFLSSVPFLKIIYLFWCIASLCNGIMLIIFQYKKVEHNICLENHNKQHELN